MVTSAMMLLLAKKQNKSPYAFEETRRKVKCTIAVDLRQVFTRRFTPLLFPLLAGFAQVAATQRYVTSPTCHVTCRYSHWHDIKECSRHLSCLRHQHHPNPQRDYSSFLTTYTPPSSDYCFFPHLASLSTSLATYLQQELTYSESRCRSKPIPIKRSCSG
jgi:hypothetical protein